MSIPYSIAIAGSTQHTVKQAQALLEDKKFSIPFVLTPLPKPIGRKQVLTKNSLHLWAEAHSIPVILVQKKLDQDIRTKIQKIQSGVKNSTLDFLLVVDFGYLIPKWLLELPSLAPLNIHPSDLPKYRGSSPGQFTLLYGEASSAVTLMVMNEALDEGDLIYQHKFEVQKSWQSATDFYHFAFTQISQLLPDLISNFATKKLKAVAQPPDSPTPIARRLSREDGYVSWHDLQPYLHPDTLAHLAQLGVSGPAEVPTTSQILQEVCTHSSDWANTITNAIRGLSPWPGVWSIIEIQDTPKRLKLLEASIKDQKIILESIQIEGEKVCKITQLS